VVPTTSTAPEPHHEICVAEVCGFMRDANCTSFATDMPSICFDSPIAPFKMMDNTTKRVFL
jgi:hypothetical protein